MRKLIQLLALTLALMLSAQAGIMQNGSPEPPSPTPSPTPSQATTAQEPEGGEMQNGEPETASQTALGIIADLLTLL